MRSVLLPLVAALAFPCGARADDAADAKAIVEKAIKARGDKLDNKNMALTWKDVGTVGVGGLKLPYTADWSFQAPDKYRFVFGTTLGDTKIAVTIVVNGAKAWQKEGDTTEELTGEKGEQTRTDAYLRWVTGLTPLVTDAGFALATAKGKEVDQKPTVAVKVTRDKHPAVTLYFDKDSGLLVKRENSAKDELQKWKEVLDEAFFSDYKETNGRKQFTKLKIVRDGKTIIEAAITDVKEVEKLDAKLFEKP